MAIILTTILPDTMNTECGSVSGMTDTRITLGLSRSFFWCRLLVHACALISSHLLLFFSSSFFFLDAYVLFFIRSYNVCHYEEVERIRSDLFGYWFLVTTSHELQEKLIR